MAGCDASPFLSKIKEKYPDKSIEIWFQDESRGQKPRVKAVYAECGSRPSLKTHGGFKNAYLFGAVNPKSGNHKAFISQVCNTFVMNYHLTEIAESVSESVHIVMITDGAGWHRSSALEIPHNISLCPLPPYSPELNAIERLWLWIKEKYFSNQVFELSSPLFELKSEVGM